MHLCKWKGAAAEEKASEKNLVFPALFIFPGKKFYAFCNLKIINWKYTFSSLIVSLPSVTDSAMILTSLSWALEPISVSSLVKRYCGWGYIHYIQTDIVLDYVGGPQPQSQASS